MRDEQTAYMINLAGNPVKLVIDIAAMGDIEQTLELMKAGLSKKTYFQLLDPPYDIREITVILMCGINGGYRSEGMEKRISFIEVQQLLGKHFNMTTSAIMNDKSIPMAERTKKFVKSQEDFMTQISEAMRLGLGYKVETETEIKGNPETATAE